VALVAGIDSSTQSCKVVVCDAADGSVVRGGTAAHPPGTEIDPEHWWTALGAAVRAAGGLADVAAVAVAGQQHGMVCLDETGSVVRRALLWNDTRSAEAAAALVSELDGGSDGSGRAAWASAVGSVPLAAFTVAKLRWLAEHEPAEAARTAAVALPHDWLTWRLGGAATGRRLDELVTDRSDASGTGYFDPSTGGYRLDLLRRALGHEPALPRVLDPAGVAGELGAGEPAGDGPHPAHRRGTAAAVLGPGCGDNAGAALGLGARPGDVVVSIGTSGVVSAVSETGTADPTGIIAGFADGTGRFLPLVCTLNAARVLDTVGRLLGVGPSELADLALRADPGAGGLVLVPYLEGERTPDRPTATGALHGITLGGLTREGLARAAVEGVLCGLADGLGALRSAGVACERVLLVGGGARSAAVQRIAPSVLGLPVAVPVPGEYVAVGAARQAAWVLSGAAEPPEWPATGLQRFDTDPVPAIRRRYADARDCVLEQLSTAGRATIDL
jgi:xylulokinase